jgi:hypothetical protein
MRKTNIQEHEAIAYENSTKIYTEKSETSKISDIEYINLKIQSKLFIAYEELLKNKIPINKTILIRSAKVASTDAYSFIDLVETLVSNNLELIDMERMEESKRQLKMRQHEENKKREQQEAEQRVLDIIEKFRSEHRRISKTEVAFYAGISLSQFNKCEKLLNAFNKAKDEINEELKKNADQG